MCTCLHFKKKATYFGRNLDLEYRFGEQVAITPRNYSFQFKNGTAFTTKYALIGMASVVRACPLYAEASNEKGLSMAGLYFPGNACFFDAREGKLNLAPYELIPYFLGQYSTVAELKADLARLNITNIPFEANLPVTDLHWMISDKEVSIVMEQTSEGLKIYDNPVGVLTNNPPFSYHLANLNNYMGLTPQYSVNRFCDKLDLAQYGNGMGAIGLPGDASPASRFIRAAFNKSNSDCSDDEESAVSQFFHILDSVAMVRGATITKEGKPDFTVYSCCVNTEEGIYYYKTYTNNQITAVKMTEETKNKAELTVYALEEKQQIKYV